MASQLPKTADVLVIGSGYTGLNAALELGRGGQLVVVCDSGDAGAGCSTRNGGQIGTSIKPSLAHLTRRYGEERARAIRAEGMKALDWIEDFVAREAIDCDFRRGGRFHGAHTPRQFERLAKEAEQASKDENTRVFVVPREEQAKQLGTEAYHGGVVFTDHAALHPGKYHRGLLERTLAAGVEVVPFCEAHSMEREGGLFRIETAKGMIRTRDVVVATNGYTSNLTPWLNRRVIPIGSYIIASEKLPRDLIEQLFPSDRVISDTRRVVYYYRTSPDKTRILFGGRASAFETDLMISNRRLHGEMGRIFPELRDTKISHAWMGMVGYSFDELPHIGHHDGLHYALSYCGSGVSMASYLGMRLGKRVLGRVEGKTAFDDLPFPTRPFYRGSPWFMPAVVAWHRWTTALSMLPRPWESGLYIMVEVGKVPFQKVTVAYLPFMVPLMLVWIAFTVIPELGLWLTNRILGPDQPSWH